VSDATGTRLLPVIRRNSMLYIHTCGATEFMTVDERVEVGGGCDACESGSSDYLDWRPVFSPGGHGGTR
jgi:hypothetical protein